MAGWADFKDGCRGGVCLSCCKGDWRGTKFSRFRFSEVRDIAFQRMPNFNMLCSAIWFTCIMLWSAICVRNQSRIAARRCPPAVSRNRIEPNRDDQMWNSFITLLKLESTWDYLITTSLGCPHFECSSRKTKRTSTRISRWNTITLDT